jgi:hypothetical protein
MVIPRSRSMASHRSDLGERDTQDVPIEEEEGAEGDVLSGCGDVSLDGEMGEESADFGSSQSGRIPAAVKGEVLADYAEIGLLRAIAEVPQAADLPAGGVEIGRSPNVLDRMDSH